MKKVMDSQKPGKDTRGSYCSECKGQGFTIYYSYEVWFFGGFFAKTDFMYAVRRKYNR